MDQHKDQMHLSVPVSGIFFWYLFLADIIFRCCSSAVGLLFFLLSSTCSVCPQCQYNVSANSSLGITLVVQIYYFIACVIFWYLLLSAHRYNYRTGNGLCFFWQTATNRVPTDTKILPSLNFLLCAQHSRSFLQLGAFFMLE